jgi:para-nitrobenzyl esterase
LVIDYWLLVVERQDSMRTGFSVLTLHIVVVLGSILLPACSRNNLEVRVEQGLLCGTPGTDPSIRVYKGVPFAAPPVGDLRWKAPQPPGPWTGVRPADKFSPACTQNLAGSRLPWTEEYMHQGEQSEDCLYLNIWTGAKSQDEKRPVMVYIYGGGFTEGSNAVAVYDGEALARKGVVQVGINYRLGPLGFLAHPELTKESEHRSSGNYGLLDQVAALRWVHDNIAVFGGDPEQVTIFGQSAGAMSVAYLMQSPLAEGLFARAVIQSGPGLFSPGTGNSGNSLENGEQAGVKFAEAKGAASIADLRAMPAEALIQEPSTVRFSPLQDGWFLPANGKNRNQVPVMNGFTADDMGAGGSFGPPSEATIQAYEKEARERYGERAKTFLSLYPADSDETVPSLRKESARERARVSLYLWAVEQAKVSGKVYTYYFDRAIPWPEHPEFGAFHSGELPYVFNNLRIFDRPWEAFDRTIANQISSYWVNFAGTGDPNGQGLATWPVFSAAEAVTMQLSTRMGAMPIADPEKVDFWKGALSEGGPQ